MHSKKYVFFRLMCILGAAQNNVQINQSHVGKMECMCTAPLTWVCLRGKSIQQFSLNHLFSSTVKQHFGGGKNLGQNLKVEYTCFGVWFLRDGHQSATIRIPKKRTYRFSWIGQYCVRSYLVTKMFLLIRPTSPLLACTPQSGTFCFQHIISTKV